MNPALQKNNNIGILPGMFESVVALLAGEELPLASNPTTDRMLPEDGLWKTETC
jgi:hypothetical protein